MLLTPYTMSEEERAVLDDEPAPQLTAYQVGQGAHLEGVCRFENPYPMGSADFASWRRGWDSNADAARMSRMAARPTRQVYHDNMNYSTGGR